MKMIEKDSVFRAELSALQEVNAQLELQISEYGNVKLACSENLDSMRTNLDALQDLVVKCKAVLSIHESQTSTHQRSSSSSSLSLATTTSSSSPAKVSSSSSSPLSQSPNNVTALKSEIEVLKAQLDIYKSDFAEERIARLALLAEKNRLTAELKQLQQQNRALIVDALNGQAELLTYSRRCSRMSQEIDETTVPAATFSNNDPQTATVDDSYNAERKASFCQHCNGIFSDIQSLETHIDECPAY